MSEVALSSQAVYSAKPTVRVDTQAYAKINELLIGMEMREREGGMSALELRLSNIASDPQGGADLAFEDDEILKLGATIAVYGGDENAPNEIFRGIITGIEAEFAEKDPPELVILAEDAFQQARMTRRTQTHEDVSISDLATTLANTLGLQPVITGYSTPLGTRAQLNESDLAFLRRLLARYDGDLQVVGEEMHVSPRADVRRGEITLALHSQLRSARVTADLAHQVNKVTVSGWDALRGERIDESSDDAALGPGSGQTGADILRDAVVERNHHVSHLAVTTAEEASALADAIFHERARRFVCVSGTAEGNPALRVGSHVALGGLGPRFDNTYYVVQARHRWDIEKGYETDFEAECAYWGGHA